MCKSYTKSWGYKDGHFLLLGNLYSHLRNRIEHATSKGKPAVMYFPTGMNQNNCMKPHIWVMGLKDGSRLWQGTGYRARTDSKEGY